jgi:hypothetical protein
VAARGALLVAIGVNERGYREILGICEGAKEDKTGWSAFLKHLKERGLKGVRLITSDACIGLAESIASVSVNWASHPRRASNDVGSHLEVVRKSPAFPAKFKVALVGLNPTLNLNYPRSSSLGSGPIIHFLGAPWVATRAEKP